MFPRVLLKKVNVPSILKDYKINVANDVILGVKAPPLYGSTIQRCLTLGGHLSWFKSHDHMNVLRVYMLNT